MKTLKELLEQWKPYGVSDIQIIQAYLEQDGMGASALDSLINSLKRKIEQIETENTTMKSNLHYSFSYYYKNYDFKTAETLDTLTRIMMLDIPFNKEQIEWMKTFKIKTSVPFWHDLAEVIHAIQDESYKPLFLNTYSSWGQVLGIISSEDKKGEN